MPQRHSPGGGGGKKEFEKKICIEFADERKMVLTCIWSTAKADGSYQPDKTKKGKIVNIGLLVVTARGW